MSKLIEFLLLINFFFYRMMQPDSVFRGIAWVWDRPFLRVFLKSFIFIVKPFTNKRHWKVKEIVTFSRFINGTLFDEVGID